MPKPAKGKAKVKVYKDPKTYLKKKKGGFALKKKKAKR